LTEHAHYTPPGPGIEAAIEVEMHMTEGPVYLRIPASIFAKAFGTVGDSREQLFRTFIDKKYGIWPKLWKKAIQLLPGEAYTVTPDDFI
jgi:hypothetical protein